MLGRYRRGGGVRKGHEDDDRGKEVARRLVRVRVRVRVRARVRVSVSVRVG